MSHFYGYLQGNRGQATRCGSEQSGIGAHIRSWNHDVYADLKEEKGEDVLRLSVPEGLMFYLAGKRFVIKDGEIKRGKRFVIKDGEIKRVVRCGPSKTEGDIMKVKELIEKHDLWLRYAADRHMVAKNDDADVLAYAVVHADGKVRNFAFLFRSARLIIGMMDGMRVQSQEALAIIETMSVEREALKDESVRRELFADAL